MSKTVCFSFKPMQRSNEPSYVCFLNIYYFIIAGSEARQDSDKRIAEIFNASSPSETRPESGCSDRLFQMEQQHFETSIYLLLMNWGIVQDYYRTYAWNAVAHG